MKDMNELDWLMIEIRQKASTENFEKATDDARVYVPELDFHNGCTDACDPFEQP